MTNAKRLRRSKSLSKKHTKDIRRSRNNFENDSRSIIKETLITFEGQEITTNFNLKVATIFTSTAQSIVVRFFVYPLKMAGHFQTF